MNISLPYHLSRYITRATPLLLAAAVLLNCLALASPLRAAEQVELSGYVAIKSVDCFNPDVCQHTPEFFVVDDATGQRLQLEGYEDILMGIDPKQKVRVKATPADSMGTKSDGTKTAADLQILDVELLPLKEPTKLYGATNEKGGANSLEMLSCLLVFISTDTNSCMTSETNARNLLFNNTNNSNEGMQAITKGRYGLRLGNGTGVEDDHTIDLLLNVNSGDHDTDSIETLALNKLFVDSAAQGGLELNRTDWDRILLFAPGGITDSGFTAYAYYPFGSYTTQGMVSMYGNSYGNNRMNGFLHELGHNFGFAHSSKGGSEYGDRTCVMGLSNDSTKTETYSVAKLMETNWLDAFNNAPGTDASLTITQDITVDLYPLSSDLTVVDETVAIRVSGTDYYISYHIDDRPYGYLSQSGDRNKVFVYTRASGSRQRSFQVGNLSEEDVFEQGNIEVQFGAYGAGNDYATVSIDVNDSNTKPELITDVYGTGQNQAIVLAMPATDADGDTITYATLSNPSNGVLSGSYPNITYTPDTDFTGSDSFRITASDALISNFIDVTVLTFIDTDTDGLEDSWEIQYFGDLSPMPTGNPDNDQEDNLTEFQNGTDPTRAPTQFANALTGTVIGTPGSYLNDPSWDKDEAWDGDFSTFYDALNATGDWTGLDLGSPKKFSLIRFAARSGWGSRMNGGQFQGSNTSDFSSDVVTFHTVNTNNTPSGEFTDQIVNDAGSYRYIRYIGPTDGYCNIAEIEFYEDGAPDAPTNLIAAAVTGSVSLDWDDNTDLDFASYQVYRGTDPGTFNPTPIATGLTTSQYTDSTVINNTTYYYYVSAVDTDGYEGANSNEASVTYVINEFAPVVDAGDNQTVTLSGGTAWTPAQLSLTAWYDASDVSTIDEDGGAVSLWEDKSGNGLHLTSTSGREPTTGTNTINGTNALDFTSDEMSTASNPFGTSVSDALVIAVHKVDNDNNQGTMFTLTGSDSSGSRWQCHAPYSGTAYFDCGGTGGANRINANYGTDTGDNVLVAFYGSTTDSVQHIYKNGELLVGDSSGHSINTVGNIFVGSGESSSYQDTSIGEFIIINGTVSPEDRQNLEGYLAHKWGLAGSLPGGHPYEASPPGGAGTEITLDGTVSDPDGNAFTVLWEKVSGPGAVTFVPATDVDTTAYISEAGTYVFSLTADDTVYQTSDNVTITVTEAADTDSDGMDDTWENTYFGNLDRDGTGDFDGDGIIDLDEFINSTDPTVDTVAPAAPTGLLATIGDGSVSLDWNDNVEADFSSYTVYRSTSSGSDYVALQSGIINSNYVDNAATNGTEYFYVVSALDTSANESDNSSEVSATPEGGLLVQEGPSGLEYEFYANEGQANAVNIVPDWSRAGYMGGGVEIPFVPAQVTVNPSGGDDTTAIQNAIDTVSALSLVNGFRGAVYLSAGDYTVTSTLSVTADGVIIRGAGQQETGGTTVTFDVNTQQDLFRFEGVGFPTASGTTTAITDSYVPVGSNTLNVTDASGFSVGDMVQVRNLMNQDWIDAIGMTVAGGLNGEPDDPAWDPYDMVHYRYIDAIDGNTMTLDSPITQAIETQYGGGEVEVYTYPDALENVGIEGLRLESTYASETDNNHGWQAIEMRYVKNGWVRQVTSRYFGMGLVFIERASQFITVEDCASLDPKSEITGGNRYSFYTDESTYLLFQRNLARDGRHDYVSGSRTQGPNAFVDSRADSANADIGPHFRYATAELYDNILTDNEINVQNRLNAGTAHGWSGAQVMFWNVEANSVICDAPTGAMNWSIGTVGTKSESPSFMSPWEPFGIWQSEQNPVAPRSLYYAQLRDRLGIDAVHNVILPQQEAGRIWSELQSWDGDGLLLDGVVTWYDSLADLEVGNTIDISARIRNLEVLGNLVSTTWSKATGPGNVTFGDDSALVTTMSFSELGTYEVQLTADDGSSPISGSFTVVVTDPNELGPPAAPTGLAATPGEGQISLDWDDNAETDLASYTVYRSEASGSYGAALDSGLSSSDYVDSTAVPGTAYFYVVTAVDTSVQESSNSNEVSGVATEPNIPPSFDNEVVVEIDATANDAYSASIADDASDGNTTPDPINFSKVSGPEWLTVALNGDLSGTPDIGDVGLNQWIVEVDDGRSGTGQATLRITVNADVTAPAAPANLVALAGDAVVSLNWDDNGESDLASYTVYRSTTSGFTVLQSGLVTSQYTDTTVVNETEYSYLVTAFDTTGNESGNSNEDSATPTAITQVSILATDNAFIRANSPDIVFDVSQTFQADRAQFIFGGREAWIRFPLSGDDELGGVDVDSIDSVTLELHSTNTSTHIMYVYAALDLAQFDGTTHSESSWTGGTAGTEATGGNLTANTRPFGISNSNFPVAGLSTIKIGEAQNVDSGQVLQITITEMDVFRDLIRDDTNGEISLVMNSSLSGGDNFFASVYNTQGNPKPTLVVDIAAPDITPPVAPTGLAATGATTSISLDWNDNAEGDLASYTVYRSTSSGSGYASIANDVATSDYTDSAPTQGTVYYYVVSAVDTNSNESDQSAEVSGLTDDGDGIPDDWEVNNIGNTTNESDVDTDGDGVANFLEYLYGSLPNDASDKGFVFKAETTGGSVVFGWDVQTGLEIGTDYLLEISTDLMDPGSWMLLPVEHYDVSYTPNGGKTKVELNIKEAHEPTYGDDVYIRLRQP